MSLYGNVKRVASAQFQFDRIYPNRDAMETALQNKTDGVHQGRYVLIEYGERYAQPRDENGELMWRTLISSDADGNPVEKQVPMWEEVDTYKNNAEIDKEIYGINYDSTVWQKIYTTTYQQYADGTYKTDANDQLIPESHEKFIMIAELNAILPKLDLTAEKNQIYFPADEEHPEEEIYDAFNNKVDGVASQIIYPYFDKFTDTELTYLMHYPTPLRLNVQSEGLDYHQAGFNVAYSTVKDPTPSYIHWTTDNFYGFDYNSEGEKIDETTINTVVEQEETPIEPPAKIDSKTLKMHMPDFGNVMNDLYDLLYGRPAYEYNPDGTIKRDKNGEPVFEYLRDTNGNIIYDEEGNPRVDPLRPYFKEWRDKYPYIMDLTKNPPEPTDIERKAWTDAQDNYYWLQFVPDISKILTNNSMGLINILKNLFAVTNPLTGEIKYWFMNDWTAEEFHLESNQPTITNKPEIVTYLTKTEYQNLSALFEKHHETDSNRQHWLSGVNIIKLVNGSTSPKIPYSNSGQRLDQPEAIKDPQPPHDMYTENYEYYTTIKDENKMPLEDGHWFLDYDTWTLRHVNNFSEDLLEVTIGFSCENDCELACQNNCDTVCQLSCESNCERDCELYCQNNCQLICQSNCESSCQSCDHCQQPCQLSCQSCNRCEGCVTCQNCDTCQSCNASCETTCLLSCQSCDTCEGCNTCQSCNRCQGCEGCDSCNNGCDTCQGACEASCQSGCQIGCQSCDSSCNTNAQNCAACDTTHGGSCQTTCERCQSCNTSCESACERNCQSCDADCEDCELSELICEDNSEFVICETQAEICSDNCQSCDVCESDQECIICNTGCDTMEGLCELTETCEGCNICDVTGGGTCQTGLSPCGSCDSGCQICEGNCQGGCQINCDGMCEGCDACESSCQTNCQRICEGMCEGCDACESSCQTNCQRICEGMCEGCDACESSCQTGCQNCDTTGGGTCQDGCEMSYQNPCDTICQYCQGMCEGCDACESSCQRGL